jgi:hypothetical protein
MSARITAVARVVFLAVLSAWFISLLLLYLSLPSNTYGREPAAPTGARALCPACIFAPLREPTSTRRDVVLAAALTELKRVEYFLRTLRTTGTRARVILFLDDEKTATDDWLRFFSACDIEPVFVTHADAVVRSAPKLSRYYFYQQWLRAHIREVDRVIHTDTFDVIFQSDPFLPSIDAAKLYFTFEPVVLRDSHWTMNWMVQCFGKAAIAGWLDRPVSCSGVTVGGARPFLAYLETLLGIPNWTNCFGHSLDQAHHNFLYYRGDFERAGIVVERLDCNSDFLTMHFCCKKAKCELKENGMMYGNNSAVAPALLHQYNRWKNLTNRNAVICPAPPGGILSVTSKAEPAALEALPPLITAYPNLTLWPPS